MDADLGGAYESVTLDGLTVTSNGESADEMTENLSQSQEKPKDGPPPDPEAEEAEKVSRAARELGKKGGQAAAEARKAAEDETDEEKPAKPLGKPRDDPRARMLEATRKESEAKKALQAERQERERDRQERERLAAEVRELRQRIEQPATVPQPSPARQPPPQTAAPDDPADPRPVEDQFNTYAEFVEARARWAARQEYETRRAQAWQARQEQEYHARVNGAVETFNQRLSKASEETPDLMDRISPEILALRPSFALQRGEQATAHTVIANEILGSERAPALMLHLTEHPEDFQRIAALSSPLAIAKEVAKLEARLEAAPAGISSPAPSSKANPPIRPVIGSPQAVDGDSEDEPFEAFVRKHNARDQSRRRAPAR